MRIFLQNLFSFYLRRTVQIFCQFYWFNRKNCMNILSIFLKYVWQFTFLNYCDQITYFKLHLRTITVSIFWGTYVIDIFLKILHLNFGKLDVRLRKWHPVWYRLKFLENTLDCTLYFMSNVSFSSSNNQFYESRISIFRI